MHLCIPGIGDAIKLTVEWSFKLQNERRNKTLFEHVFPDQKWEPSSGFHSGRWWRCAVKHYDVTLPVGTELVFDRYYMAKDSADYHSITFIIRKNGPVMKNKRQLRFWVKLADANKIQCDKV
jgi:hypothetical protein